MRPSAQATPTSGTEAFWSVPQDRLLAATAAIAEGLSAAEAARRLARDGPNAIEVAHPHRGLRLLVAQFTSPIVVILVAATVLSMALGDLSDGLIILVIVAASGALGFWQERTAGHAVDALMAQVRVEVEARRGGGQVSVPVEEVVVGDLVVLRAGDVVPADGRVVRSQELLVDEAALTGESYAVEKRPGVVAADTPLAARSNSVFMGTHVVSGAGEAIVARTGRATQFGAVSARLADRRLRTGFERGITQFGVLLVRAMVVVVTAIFVVNLVLHRPLVDSLLFSLALAVGLTPQLLPAIVSVSLSAGARRMAAEKVIVKRLDAIEDFGAMTVLCTDKTGTITAGAVHLDRAVDPSGRASEEVLRLARLNAGLQRSFPNPLDRAILAGAAPAEAGARLDELPYDFQRKRLSVLVDDHGSPLLVTKGAFDKVLEVCATAEVDGRTVPLGQVRAGLERSLATLSADGYRVLALASRPLDRTSLAGTADETRMTLRGLLAFLDPPSRAPPRPSAAWPASTSRSVWSPATTGWPPARSPRPSGSRPSACSPAATSTGSTTRPWPGGPATPRCSPRSSPSTRSVSSARCASTIRSSASSATGSTTPPPCTPPTSASRSTPRSTWLGRRPPSCCSTRAWPWWPTASDWAARPSPTPSSTSGSRPAPTSATCSAWPWPPRSCRSCRCFPVRSCCSTSCPTSPA